MIKQFDSYAKIIVFLGLYTKIDIEQGIKDMERRYSPEELGEMKVSIDRYYHDGPEQGTKSAYVDWADFIAYAREDKPLKFYPPLPKEDYDERFP